MAFLTAWSALSSDVCRVSEIALRLYLHDGTKIRHLTNDESGKSDLFMGHLKFAPDFDRRGTVDRWYDVTDGGGQVNVAVTFRPSTKQSLSIEDFDLLKVIAKGSYGHVMQVRKKNSSPVYALQAIRKARLALRSEITHTLVERTVLAKVNSPFIVPLKFSFQTPAKLYLVLPDLKPENILLDYTGHLALSDFGLCKFNMPDQDTTDTFESLEYLAPEVLLGHQYSKISDWWTLGLFLYEMLTGLPPFYDENQYEMYRKILQDPLRFGDEVGPEARSLLTAVLTRDPSQRLGVNGADEIKRHPFFSKYIDFEKLLAKNVQPPVAGVLYDNHFEQAFTSQSSFDFVASDMDMSETVRAQFEGLSYNGEAAELNEGGQSSAG
ncbi:hypothetical protein FRC00_011809 [Tulasnella sp. 408]|nr:hypothetical protein FRC00_011809 [Tulasnella sp. 408]